MRVNGKQSLEQVLAALEVIRCPAVCDEMMLHAMVVKALENAGLAPEHEMKLAPRCRIDVMCGGIGIEIKKSRPQPAVLCRQLERYAACERVEQLVVIAPRGVSLPRSMSGKRVTMVALERLWGISLP